MNSVPLLAFAFINPLLAGIALLTGVIPVIIHLLNKKRFVRVPWAAMSFLQAAMKRSARRMQFEHWLLLLTRMAVIVLLGLAIARPYVQPAGFIPLGPSGVHRVILVDNSLSMNAVIKNEVTRFSIAKDCALNLLTSFPEADSVSVLTLSAPNELLVAKPTLDRRLVRERLLALKPTERATDTLNALRKSIELFNQSVHPKENRAVYLISDLPLNVWKSTEAELATPTMLAARQLAELLHDPETDFNIIHIDDTLPSNVAVTALTSETPFGGVNIPLRLTVEVTNFGFRITKPLSLQIHRDGQLIRRQPLPPLEAGASTLASITTEFTSPGTHLLEAKIVNLQNEALSVDDGQFLSLEVKPATRVLLVDGQLGPDRLSGQAGFYAMVLAPRVQDMAYSTLEPKTITIPELLGEQLSNYAVTALCNVHKLSKESWERLSEYVSDGGGLIIFGGDLLDAQHYNQMGYADGTGLLPGLFVVDAFGPEEEITLGFKLTDPAHPLLRDFMAQPESGLFSARVDHYLPFEVDEDRGEVALTYTDDAPAMVVSKFGKGRVLVYTTSANMAWNNLPAKGDYVSLMLATTSYLARRHGEHRNLTVGDHLQELLRPQEHNLPLRVTYGSKASTEPALIPVGDGLMTTFGPLEHAGVVKLKIGPELRLFAVNPDPAESDLRSIHQKAFQQALGGAVHWVADPMAVAKRPVTAASTELGSILLFMVLILLLLEMWLALGFGSARGVAAVKHRHPIFSQLRTWLANSVIWDWVMTLPSKLAMPQKLKRFIKP